MGLGVKSTVARWMAVALALAGAQAALCQTYIVKTVAGGNLPVDVPAVAVLGGLGDGAVGPNGDIYLPLQDYNMVVRVDSAGMVRLVAGNGKAGSSGDGGPATAASLNSPMAVALDSAGNVFVSDASCVIRMISADGTISKVAGNGSCGAGGADGPALTAQLSPALASGGG